MKKILVTGAGAPGGPGIIQALNQKYSVHGADADAKATGAPLCDLFHQVPFALDNGFISRIIDIVKENHIDVILPLVTKELNIFASYKEEFELMGCKVIVCDKKVLQICNNKNTLLKFLDTKGMSIPKYYPVRNLSSLKNAITQLGYPKTPVCIKPSESNGMRGFRILDQNVDLNALFWNEKPNNCYIEFADLSKVLGSDFKEILVMEYLPGDEFTIDCIANNGKAVLILPRKRIKMNNGISVKGKFINEPTIIAYCETIIKELQLHGPIGVQLKADEHGLFKMLEINPRLQGTTVAAKGLNINIPDIIVEQALGIEPKINLETIDWGKEFGRYYTETFWD